MPKETSSQGKPLSRRSLFHVGARIGAGLVAFVPAAGILLQNTTNVFAGGTCCSSVQCYNAQYHRWMTYLQVNGTLTTCSCTTPPDC